MEKRNLLYPGVYGTVFIKSFISLYSEIFHSRLTGSFNVYRDLSKDVLIDVSIAPSLGFSSYKENL